MMAFMIYDGIYDGIHLIYIYIYKLYDKKPKTVTFPFQMACTAPINDLPLKSSSSFPMQDILVAAL
jgi:hypothetical protein